MDKLTTIKIKYEDETYSDEIPVSVLAENVEWDSTHTLVDILGSVDVDTTGSIQDQISRLFNEKVSATQLQDYVASQLNDIGANPVGSAVVVDSSLTISGAAADAKIVGDILGNIDTDTTGSIQDQIGQLSNEKVSNSDMQSYVSSNMNTYITTWLNNNVNPVGSAVAIDSSLTVSGAAADAKVTGDHFSQLNAAIVASESAYNIAKNNKVDVIARKAWMGNAPATKFSHADNTSRCASKNMYKVSKGDSVVYYTSLDVYFFEISDIESNTILAQNGWNKSKAVGMEKRYTVQNDSYLIINLRKSNDSSVSLADFDGYIYVTGRQAFNIPEKAVHVYQFGGQGNDWCFVRTPSNYDPNRAKPYPFVICNHGNGWVMDGTMPRANWTKRTMYVPLNDPDYVSDPTEYNGTSDKSLWYSNPTIEALLSAGYVVCGCENYGDSLYGNNDCRNACVDFFYHMVSHYNVESRCYMIGASNGAMTSLNAAYLLQGKVKAMILQYPLTCLVSQYEHYANHKAEIRTAYGIEDANISLSDLAKAVATHDPLTVDVVNNIKVGAVPPIKFYYSTEDNIVNSAYNTIPLYNLLIASNKVTEKVACEGEHGDHSHFAPADYVAWFDAN